MRISWQTAAPRSQPDGERDDRRQRARMGLGCEALDGRQLLSGMTAALPSGPLIPPAVEVANATAALQGRAGQDFARLSADLSSAQGHSHVTAAQFANLQRDAATIDSAIESAGFDPATTQAKVNKVQDTIDGAFLAATYRRTGWDQVQGSLESAASGAVVSPTLVRGTVAAMEGVARSARVTPQEHAALVADQQAVTADLGANVDINLGFGAARDPLVVYDDGQVGSFVRTS